jgi:hypothetical protein
MASVKHADTMLERNDRNYGALDAKGLALCGMALLDAAGYDDRMGRAIESYRAARAINKDAGYVARVLRLLDGLAAADPQGAEKLAEARKAAEG